MNEFAVMRERTRVGGDIVGGLGRVRYIKKFETYQFFNEGFI